MSYQIEEEIQLEGGLIGLHDSDFRNLGQLQIKMVDHREAL